MHAALAVMAVERALVLVTAGELLQLAQVLAEPLGWDGRVLPAFVRVGLSRQEGRCAEPGFAYPPDVLLALRIVVELRAAEAAAGALERGDDLPAALVGLLLGVSADLDQ